MLGKKGPDLLHGMVTVQLTCAFVFARAKSSFSNDEAHL